MLGRFLSLLGLWPFGQRASAVAPPPVIPLAHSAFVETQLVEPVLAEATLIEPCLAETKIIGADS